ncbi:ABC transporter ATP-binding protein [Bradyrhizobium genosp. P]|uniref:ABC transporter ATP-binding protein n=1 Tax=Bradyrhizobium genosp. P TaxID=83641 RepID=UPI003CFB149A
MRIRKHKIAGNIYLLQFETQYELTATFLRIQEHYESPQFHGRVFGLEQYMDWYAKRHGNFTYYQDWTGFNVPSTALRPFYDGKFDPLSEKEKRLLALFAKLRKAFYVIGIYGRGETTLQHELAHALYFVDHTYRDRVREAIARHNTARLEHKIAEAGYAKHVIPDELQAYLIGPSAKLGRGFHALAPLRRQLRRIYSQHARPLAVPRLS